MQKRKSGGGAGGSLKRAALRRDEDEVELARIREADEAAAEAAQ